MTGVSIGIVSLAGRDTALGLPRYASAGAAGMDVEANLPPGEREGGRVIAPGERTLVRTGLALEIPEGFEVQLRPRSGLALREGLTLLNSPGTIDSDYRGEVGVIVINHGQAPVTIAHGSRIAQIVAAPVARIVWQTREALQETARGTGGFGSTGIEAAAGPDRAGPRGPC